VYFSSNIATLLPSTTPTASSNNLSDILDGSQEEWFQIRGKVKGTGRFAKTPVAHLEAAHAHWDSRYVLGREVTQVVSCVSVDHMVYALVPEPALHYPEYD